MISPLKRRAIAAQKTLDAFKGQRFKFGRNDCAQMVRRHLINMGCPVRGWAQAGTYHSLHGGLAALKRLGFANLHEAMDSRFERIAPAMALAGDVIAVPGMEGPGALSVYLGNQNIICWVEDVPGAVVCEPLSYDGAAWRVPVK